MIDVTITAYSNYSIQTRENREVPEPEGTTGTDMEYKAKAFPVVTGTLRVVTPKLEEQLQQIPGSTSESPRKS